MTARASLELHSSLTRSQFETLRDAVRAQALANIQSGKNDLADSIENVAPLREFVFPAVADGQDASVFLCATVCMHTDGGDIPRWNTLVYLGTVEESAQDISHVIYSKNVSKKWLDENHLDRYMPNGSKPGSLRGAEHRVALKPGDIVTLDLARPHWMTVLVDGKELGEVATKSTSTDNVDALLHGVEPATITAMFSCVASHDEYVVGPALNTIMASMEVIKKYR